MNFNFDMYEVANYEYEKTFTEKKKLDDNPELKDKIYKALEEHEHELFGTFGMRIVEIINEALCEDEPLPH